MFTEIVGGRLTNSLTLLADAAHMFNDETSLRLTSGAIWLSREPTSPLMSPHHRRAPAPAA